MIESEKDFSIVRQSLTGKREVDEKTFTSLSVLKSKLERLKALDERFKNIGFSPDVERLQHHNKRAVLTG